MSEALQALSGAIVEMVKSTGESVVRVEARRRLPATGLVWRSDARSSIIVTAHHVIESDENIGVGLPNGEIISATLIGSDPTTDTAVLRTEASGLRAIERAEIAEVSVGSMVLALARPGKTVQATLGIVSARGGHWRTGAGGEVDHYVQSDITMYPGFSGGPLVTAGGAIVGMNTSALARSASLTLPMSTVERVTEALMAHGRMPRGYLGVGIQPVRLPEPLQKELEQETGLIIMSVEERGPAFQAGMLMGDVLVELDGSKLTHVDALQSILRGDCVGQESILRYVRSGAVREIALTIAAQQ